MAVSEPLPQPISQLPEAGDAYGAGNIPAPIDSDKTVAIVWHPHKHAIDVGGWVAIQIPFGDIFDLPINTADSVGLLQQVQNALAAALQAQSSADKAAKTARGFLPQFQSLLSACATFLSECSRFFRRSQNAAMRAEDQARIGIAETYRARAVINRARLLFTENNIVGLPQSMGPRPQRQRQRNDAGGIIATEIFGG